MNRTSVGRKGMNRLSALPGGDPDVVTRAETGRGKRGSKSRDSGKEPQRRTVLAGRINGRTWATTGGMTNERGQRNVPWRGCP